jgi:hypothetical protein
MIEKNSVVKKREERIVQKNISSIINFKKNTKDRYERIGFEKKVK